jgi:hypothetical protein
MRSFFYLGILNVLLVATERETLLNLQEGEINVGFIVLVEVRIIIKRKMIKYFYVRDIIPFSFFW